MTIHNEAWRTIFDVKFCENKYLYHFTDIEKASKILYGNSLRFSKISTTNDTLESKPKIQSTAKNSNDVFEGIKHFKNINKDYLQLLCFTKDFKKIEDNPNVRNMLTDYSGRGFSLPRMWAQYAKNNTGICLMFDKEALINQVKFDLGISLIHNDSVNYVSKFSQYKMDPAKLRRFIYQINQYQNTMQKGFVDIDFLKNNIEFVKYNYFSKLDDWCGENEYRFLAYGEQNCFVTNIKESLVGIIVGENIEPVNIDLMRMLCQDICEIKKISFTYKGCQISAVNEEE